MENGKTVIRYSNEPVSEAWVMSSNFDVGVIKMQGFWL